MSVFVLWCTADDCAQNDKGRFQLKMDFMNDNDPTLSPADSVKEPLGGFLVFMNAYDEPQHSSAGTKCHIQYESVTFVTYSHGMNVSLRISK